MFCVLNLSRTFIVLWLKTGLEPRIIREYGQ